MSRPSGKHPAAALEKKIGYTFVTREFLNEALTHKSFHHEQAGTAPACNERLEFLGDAVIGLIVVEYLFRLGPQYTESELARMKSYLVCEAVLAEIAESVSLGGFIRLGKGEDATGGRTKKSILSDSLEALVGAVFLDGGFGTARDLVLGFFRERIDSIIAKGEFHDYKTALQEKTQLLYGILPEYRLIDQKGADHNKVFTVSVSLRGEELGTASGQRKKEAETNAARIALEKIAGRTR
ncbi:MAG: ribonuclease III [Nitrospiraceae bacterium]|nr:ribonuclease III [Nitrospiraceae bacterium]